MGFLCKENMMVTIPLGGRRGRGKYCLVDDEFYFLAEKRWCIKRNGKQTSISVVRRENGKWVNISHVVIGKPGKGFCVDHIDRNPLNNQKDNLRVVSFSVNNSNKMPYGSSGFKGVYKSDGGMFLARTKISGRHIHIGTFDNPISAAMAFDEFAEKYGRVTNRSLGLIEHRIEGARLNKVKAPA